MSKVPFLSSKLSVPGGIPKTGILKYLLIPCAVASIALSVAFRPSPLSTPEHSLSSPLILPKGWPAPPIPANNPITMEKFVLGRQLFYETELSSDRKTSCGSCHDSYISFGGGGFHVGASGDSNHPARSVMRLMNVAYDTVLTWDGHIGTLEEQAAAAIQKKGDLFVSDTASAFGRLASNPAYIQMFTAAFGDGQITMDRIAKSIATFERCIISGNSLYDQYLNGNTTAMDSSMIRGMNLFFDTTEHGAKCSECHNNLGAQGITSSNIFTDNNYYRTGTFESVGPGIRNGGYGLDTSGDTLSHFLDAGRAAVTKDTTDVGRFRTPSLRNVALHGPFGADGTVFSLSQVIANYNAGGMATTKQHPTNQDPRIKPLNLSQSQMQDLEAFLNSLTDLDFISDTRFQNPGPATLALVNDGHVVGENISAYPNPSTGTVHIVCPDITGATDIALIAPNGTIVWQRSVASDGKLQLDLSGIANGSYRLRLNAGGLQRIVPIVLAR